MNHKYTRFFYTVLFLLLLCNTSYARDHIKILVNNKTVSTDVHPIMRNASIFVPLRGVLEQLGAIVSYDKNSGMVTVERKGTIITLTLNSNSAKVNGRTLIMPVSAFSESDRTMVPLRFLSENLGCTVRFDGKKSIVYVYSDDKSLKEIDIMDDNNKGNEPNVDDIDF